MHNFLYCFGCPYDFLVVTDMWTTANMDPCQLLPDSSNLWFWSFVGFCLIVYYQFVESTSSFMHEWANHESYYIENMLQQFMHWVWHMRRTPCESDTVPILHNATGTCCQTSLCLPYLKLPSQTHLNTALLPYQTHQFGLGHEWIGVWRVH